MDDFSPKDKPKRWGSPGYIVMIVIAILLVVFVLRPLLQGAMSPFQSITSALSGQQH